PFDGSAVIGRVAAAGDGTVWVANQDSIGHLSATGGVLQRLGFQPPARIRELAVNSDSTLPNVSILSPLAGVCIADSTPTLQLSLTDLGWGVAPGSIAVAANGTPAQTSCDDLAICELTAPLADGSWTLSVSVQDYAGNHSAVAEVGFTVDTTPP